MRLWYLGDQRRLRRACASAHSRQSLMKYGSKPRVRPKNQTSRPTGWLRMRVWRISLRRTKSAIISWAGSFFFTDEKKSSFGTKTRKLIMWAAARQNQQDDPCAMRRLRLGWASTQSSLSTWRRRLRSMAILRARSEDSDQTAQTTRATHSLDFCYVVRSFWCRLIPYNHVQKCALNLWFKIDWEFWEMDDIFASWICSMFSSI